MDKSANPTPKTDRVATPAPETGGGTDTVPTPPAPATGSSSDIENRLTKLEDRLATIELRTEGNFNADIHGDYHKTVHGNSQTTVLGGTNQRVSGGRAVSVAGASVSTVGGLGVNVTGAAKGCISISRWVFSGLDFKAVGVKSENYVSKFENGFNNRLAAISRNDEISNIRSSISYLRQYAASNARAIANDCMEINKSRRAFRSLVTVMSKTETCFGLSRLNNIKKIANISDIQAFM